MREKRRDVEPQKTEAEKEKGDMPREGELGQREFLGRESKLTKQIEDMQLDMGALRGGGEIKREPIRRRQCSNQLLRGLSQVPLVLIGSRLTREACVTLAFCLSPFLLFRLSPVNSDRRPWTQVTGLRPLAWAGNRPG